MKVKANRKQDKSTLSDKGVLVNRFAELLADLFDRLQGFNLKWPYEVLSVTQIKTLILLRDEDRRMKDIGVSLGVALPSATRIIDSLVKKQLVKRRNDVDDRRRIFCSLTGKGQQVTKMLWKITQERAMAAGQFLDTDELVQVIDCLELLHRALSTNIRETSKRR